MKKSKFIDHTLLKADAHLVEIDKLWQEAVDYDFKAVCVNPSWVNYCSKKLEDTDVKVCTVVGFPLGQNTTQMKVFEAIDAIANGADEIDMVINISKLKDFEYDYVYQEIKALKEVCQDHVLKVIIETCLLTDLEIKKASELCVKAGADFVKTSTGFSHAGANVEVVKLIKSVVKDQAKIKAAGGVRTPEDLDAMIEAGADRIGTSSGTKLV